MSQIDVESLPGLRWWMKRRSAHYLRNALIFLAMAAMMGFLFWSERDDLESFSQALPLAALFLFLLVFAVSQLLAWIRSLRWHVRQHWFGTVVDTQRVRNRKGKVKSYRIHADVVGKSMEGVCLMRTFDRARPGDRVLLFTLEGDRVFCVHPDE